MAIRISSERIAIRALRLGGLGMQQCKKEQEPRLLPVMQMHGKEFVVDVENAKSQDSPPISFPGTRSTEANEA